MKKVIIVVVALLLLVAIAGLVIMGSPRGPSLSEVEHLFQPRIAQMQDQKVLLVKAKGKPGDVGKKAFGLLMKTYFKLKGVPKGGPSFKPPRARWPSDVDTPMEQWIGHYAMPVPDNLAELPDGKIEQGLTIELTTWQYGEVAEILHVGPYSKEKPTITAIKKYIQDSGYEIAGLHEEEYVKGPGMIFAGNPEKYLTIIRYQVRKIPEPPPDTTTSGE